MPEHNDTSDLRQLTDETRAIWDQKAAFWDERMGEGNTFQRVLVGPATERLIALQAGERVLDIACGNGVFARRMAALGAQVLASDFSAVFVERARARSTEYSDHIEYRVADATDEAQLLALGPEPFDAAVCSMALMDMTTITPLLRAVRQMLTPRGRFVFSLQHPCFNSSGVSLLVEEEDREGELITTYAVKVRKYLTPMVNRGAGMPNEPLPHYYFHRPLSELFTTCFHAGFVLDGLEEPTFPDRSAATGTLSWLHFTEIPPVLVARLRPA